MFGLPTSFLIDREDRVRYGLTGTTEWDKGEAVTLIEGMPRQAEPLLPTTI